MSFLIASIETERTARSENDLSTRLAVVLEQDMGLTTVVDSAQCANSKRPDILAYRDEIDADLACAPVVHAVEQARFGPFAPVRIATWPAARFTIVAVTKNGDTCPSPWCNNFLCSRSITSNAGTPYINSHTIGIRGINLETGILDRAVCRSNRQLDEAACLFQVFSFNKVSRKRTPSPLPQFGRQNYEHQIE